MYSLIIMGSGRSGTSAVAGTFAKSGYYMGDDLYPPRDSNPKGFFETPEINRINEEILSTNLAKIGLDDYDYGQRWLAILPTSYKLIYSPKLLDKMENVTLKRPFCFKDPRFSFTLPVWRKFLNNTRFVCIFRHPAITANSIVKECARMDYLKNLPMNFERAINIWHAIYTRIMDHHDFDGDALFVHYNQLLTNPGLDRLEHFVGHAIDRSFPEYVLNRSPSTGEVPRRVYQTYVQLCRLAGYSS